MIEYNRVEIKFKTSSELIDKLNSFGVDGWEVIHYSEIEPKSFGSDYKSFVLMKRINSKQIL